MKNTRQGEGGGAPGTDASGHWADEGTMDGTVSHAGAGRVYEAPRIIRRERIVASTLISGGECVFDPPGSC